MPQKNVRSKFIADPFRFAQEGRVIDGELPVAGFLRLADSLADSAGNVQYRISGALDAEQRPILTVVINGQLMLRCQRCLDSVAWTLAVSSALFPVRAGRPIPEEELEDDTVDAFEVDGEIDVATLIEDEILLGVPLVPRHETCDVPGPEKNGDGKASPFAVLASLRGGKA